MQRHTCIWIWTEKNTSFSQFKFIFPTLYFALFSHPVNIEIVVSLNSSFYHSALHHPPHLICTFFFPVQTKYWATPQLHRSASCCPNAATRFFPHRICNTHHKKTNFRCSGTLCYTFVALIKEPIIEQVLQLSVKVLCFWRVFYEACKRPLSPLHISNLWFIKAAVVSPHSSTIWPSAGDSGAWLRTVCRLTTPLGWVGGGALPLFHMSPSSSKGQTGSPAPLLPPPPPHCLSVRLQVRNMMKGDFWTVRRLSPFVPPAEWEGKLGDRREVQMSVVGRRDKSGDPQWLWCPLEEKRGAHQGPQKVKRV